MREIKFRAWDKKLKKWVDGGNGFNLLGEAMLIGGLFQDKYYSESVYRRLYRDVEIMQFIGLLDKSGVEIYEGDIIKVINGKEGGYKGASAAVEWCDCGCAAFRLQFIGMGNNDGMNWREECEVIGNIYENPELLK